MSEEKRGRPSSLEFRCGAIEFSARGDQEWISAQLVMLKAIVDAILKASSDVLPQVVLQATPPEGQKH